MVAVPQSFYFCDATGDARAVLARQVDDDWTTFLAARTADLTSGGRLLVQMVGSEDTTHGDESHVTARKLLRAMTEVAQQLVSDGKLSQSAVEGYLLPVYARTPHEARTPFEGAGSAVATFTLEVVRTDRVPNPYLDRWRSDGDAVAYGRSYAAFVRGFTESSLRSHLFTPGVTDGHDPDRVIDEYFSRLADRFAADPEADAFEDWTLTVVAARR